MTRVLEMVNRKAFKVLVQQPVSSQKKMLKFCETARGHGKPLDFRVRTWVQILILTFITSK